MAKGNILPFCHNISNYSQNDREESFLMQFVAVVAITQATQLHCNWYHHKVVAIHDWKNTCKHFISEINEFNKYSDFKKTHF